MKKQLPYIALGAEALLCLVFSAFIRGEGASGEAIAAFPLAPIGAGLRALSLSGGAGNAAAIVLYALLCLLPAGLFLFRYGKEKFAYEDVLLPICSIALFYSLYLLINPALAEARYSLMAKPALNGLVWVLLAAWLVLHLLRMAFKDREGTKKCGCILLFAMAAVYVFALFYMVPADAAEEIFSLNKANTDHGALGPSYFAMVLRAAASAVPYGLDLAALEMAYTLLDSAFADRYSERTLACSHRLARFCRVALTVDMLLCAGVYLLQLCMAPKLRSVSFDIVLPLSSVAVTLAALLLSRLIGEGKQLKEDNDLFV